MNSDNQVSLILPLILIIFIALLHFLGFSLQLYWRIGWYDRVVHILGGIWIVVMLFFILDKSHISFKHRLSLVAVGVTASLIVGIMWELFELKSGITVLSDHGYAVDTIGDIISDFCGGIIGCVYILSYWKKFVWNNQQ